MELRTVISKEREIFEEAYRIRCRVFLEEQGFSVELDDTDKTAYHAVVYDGGRPVAVGRYYGSDDPYHIGRIAVIPEYRGTGVGRYLMTQLERFAKEKGAKELTLSAQRRAEGFYASCGYHPLGDTYMDEFCPHVEMRKSLV